MNKYALVAAGIGFSALAQVVLKKSSVHTVWSMPYIACLAFAALSYFLSFVLYSFILKRFPISKIGPAMTVGTMLLVVVAGSLLFSEAITVRKVIGLIIGIASIMLVIG